MDVKKEEEEEEEEEEEAMIAGCGWGRRSEKGEEGRKCESVSRDPRRVRPKRRGNTHGTRKKAMEGSFYLSHRLISQPRVLRSTAFVDGRVIDAPGRGEHTKVIPDASRFFFAFFLDLLGVENSKESRQR